MSSASGSPSSPSYDFEQDSPPWLVHPPGWSPFVAADTIAKQPSYSGSETQEFASIIPTREVPPFAGLAMWRTYPAPPSTLPDPRGVIQGRPYSAQGDLGTSPTYEEPSYTYASPASEPLEGREPSPAYHGAFADYLSRISLQNSPGQDSVGVAVTEEQGGPIREHGPSHRLPLDSLNSREGGIEAPPTLRVLGRPSNRSYQCVICSKSFNRCVVMRIGLQEEHC